MPRIHSINAKKKFGRDPNRDSSGINDDPNFGLYATHNIVGEDGHQAGDIWQTKDGKWAAKSEKDIQYFPDRKSAGNHLDQINRSVTPLKHSEDPYLEPEFPAYKDPEAYGGIPTKFGKTLSGEDPFGDELDLSEPDSDDVIMSKYINKHVDLPPNAEPMGGYDVLGPDDDEDEPMMTDDPWPYDDDNEPDFPLPPKGEAIHPDEDPDPSRFDADKKFNKWVDKQYAGSRHPSVTHKALSQPPKSTEPNWDKLAKQQDPVMGAEDEPFMHRYKDESTMTEQEVAHHLNRLKEALTRLKEKSPKGWEGTVKAMKKHGSIDNPWALAHWMKDKGWKSHKKEAMGDAPEWNKKRQDVQVWATTSGKYGAKSPTGDTKTFDNQWDAEKFAVKKESAELLERNYRREYDKYQGTPEQKKRRAQRNKDRRKFEREGKVKKGDGKDIHHRDGNPFNHDGKNTAVMDKSKNRALKERCSMKKKTQEERLREAIRGVIKELLVRKTLTPEGKGVFDNPIKEYDDDYKGDPYVRISGGKSTHIYPCGCKTYRDGHNVERIYCSKHDPDQRYNG